jgi:LuxR family transcriptional regulator, maltose regulon positive regulatory protein
MATLAKITIPHLSGIVARGRAFKLLEGGLMRPVLWISSPAGSGKTTLVAHYLRTRKVPSLWYRLDGGDGDAATFFYYMGLAAKAAAPRFRKSLPLLTPEYVLGVPVFARKYFEVLYERLRAPFVIVLDNYHEVPADSPLHDVMMIGLSSLPDGINIIVVSRKAPPAAYTRLIANNVMSRLGWDEVRLTEEESREIILQNKGEGLSDEVSALLHRKTDGWAVGLVLLMESLRSKNFDYSLLDRLTPEEIYDYFVTEIFRKTDPREQKFLCQTAFLPSMTPEMAQKLTGNRRSPDILNRLNELNYFTERHLKDPPVFVYHPLFREFLISQARKTMSLRELRNVQQKAADVLIERDQTEDAASLLIEGAMWDRLVILILSKAPVLMSRGRTGTIEGWLEKIPTKIIEETPWLLYWRGVCKLVLSPPESRVFFEKALRAFELGRNDTGAFLAWSGAVQTYLFEFHDFRPVDWLIDWIDKRTKRGVSFPSPEIEANVVSGIVGALAWRAPFHAGAKVWMKKVEGLSEGNPNIDIRLRAYTNTAIFHIWMGEFGESGTVLDTMKGLVGCGPSSPARQILLRVVEAMHCNSCADMLPRARVAVSEGLDIAASSGVHVADTLLFLQAATNSLNENNVDRAALFLAEMKKTIGLNGNAHFAHYYYFLSWCHLISGEIRQALVAAEKSLQFIEEAGIPISETLIRLVLVQILRVSDQQEKAIDQLEAAETISIRTGSSYCLFLCGITRAQLLLDIPNLVSSTELSEPITEGSDGSPNGASASVNRFFADKRWLPPLRRALALGKSKGYATTIYFWRPGVLSHVCAAALQENIEVDYVKELIRRLHLAPPSARAWRPVDAWPYPVKVYTLGRFMMDIGGKKVAPSAKTQKKPLLLLKAIISAGGRNIREEELNDILWPDAEGDAGHNSFKTTLARLRQLLDSDKAVVMRGNMVSLDGRYCWTDAGAFEEECSEIGRIMEESKGATADGSFGEAVSRVMELYQGHFLPADAGEPWTIVARERLRSKYLNLISDLGGSFRRKGEHERAVHFYLKGLDAEPLAEEFYQGLIISYVGLDKLPEARAVYERCERTLRVILGIAPSERTRRLLEEIPKH